MEENISKYYKFIVIKTILIFLKIIIQGKYFTHMIGRKYTKILWVYNYKIYVKISKNIMSRIGEIYFILVGLIDQNIII